MIPDIPLVKGEIDLFLQVLLSLYGIADGDNRMDERIQVHRPCQEARRVRRGIAVIAVQRNIVDVLIALVQHGQFPVAKGRHLRGGGAAGHQFDGRIDPLHHLGGFIGNASVFIGCLPAHLPGTVHLISETPELDAQRILLSVGDPHVGEFGAAHVIGILHDIPCLFRTSRSEIDRVHDFGTRLL